MKKLIVAITILTSMFLFSVGAISTVSASGGIECKEVPGVYGVLTPYGTRICDTGIIFGDKELPASVLTSVVGLFVLGTGFFVNGKFLNAKVSE